MSGGASAAVRCRHAMPADAAEIVRLVRSGFAPAIVDRLIYGCDGAAAWVAAHLGLALPADRQFTVAEWDGRIVGMTDVQRTDDVAFLSYVAVDDAARGRGVAALLLAHALRRAHADGARAFALDVFEDNVVARRWYDRLGLHDVGASVWLDLAGPAGARAAADDARTSDVVVADLAPAAASHAVFGFSQLRVRTPSRAYAVGRLGARWFRLTDVDALADAHLTAALAALDPRRDVFAIMPAADAERAGGRVVLRSLRMRAPLLEVLARLAPSTHGAPARTPA